MNCFTQEQRTVQESKSQSYDHDFKTLTTKPRASIFFWLDTIEYLKISTNIIKQPTLLKFLRFMFTVFVPIPFILGPNYVLVNFAFQSFRSIKFKHLSKTRAKVII